MCFNQELLIHKLQRWDHFVAQYHLPEWEAIPNFGLYMDQVIALLQEYLSFIPAPSNSKDSFVTAATINNYVRLKIMPAPVKRKYSRIHIAYLIMILTLKLSLSISDVQKLLPAELSEEEVCSLYCAYSEKFRRTALEFTRCLQEAAQELQAQQETADSVANRMVLECALRGGFNTLLAEKIIRLQTDVPEDSEQKTDE